MTKLHEILAIERGAEAVANKLQEESKKTLSKDSLFKGMTRTLFHFSEDDRHLDTTEHQQLETTVGENLAYLRKPWAEWIDAIAEKDHANTSATANIKINGEIFLEELPASFLLGLESKLTKFRSVLEAIPTLPPGVEWAQDDQERPGVYRSVHDVSTIKDVKDTEHRIIDKATDHHPAQIASVPVTKSVGRYDVKMQSGTMAPIDKAAHLERLDTMLQAVKQARARANEQETTKFNIGELIFDFITGK